MNQKQTFDEICSKSIFCREEKCQLDHSRLYVGVCTEYLRNEQLQKSKAQICNDKNCDLWHFSQKIFRDKKKIKTINGIFPHNICAKNCKSKDCKFLHMKWASEVCLKFIVDECENKNCEFKHEEWETLEPNAKSSSVIQYITPEDLCTKPNCVCDKHPLQLKDYCILYLKGQCPKNNEQCRNHNEWENINPKISQINSIKSCIQIVQEQNKVTNDIKQFCNEQELIYFQKWFHEQNIIDVVFIMDLTGSMKQWKELMQNKISQIISQFTNSINGYQIRVAFIGYRDKCDKEDQLVYCSFTRKLDELQEFIKGLEAKGGGDYAEDIASAFEMALNLNFSHHPDSLLCTFLLADAPCHGRNYHKYRTFENDNYLDQEDKYFEKVLEKYKLIKKHNYLGCIKITDTTDIMFEKIKTVFPKLIISKQIQPDGLGDQVLFTLRRSVTESQKQKEQKNNDFEYIKANFKKFKVDTFNNNFEGQSYWKAFEEFCSNRAGETGLKVNKNYQKVEDLQSDQKTNLSESIKQHDTSSTYIFKAFDAINNREVVLKIPKFLVDNYEQKNKITEKDILKVEEEAEIRFYSSCYASQMAYCFNQKLKEYNLLQEMQPIFYAHPILYTLQKPFYGLTKIYGETNIKTKKYLFEKYTSNYNFVKRDKYFYTVFSHFSYHLSGEILAILDLQGCNNILSDPSIQTKDSWESILSKDKTNLGDKGIQVFKNSQHQNCSYLCEKLKLNKFKQYSEIDRTVCPPEQIKNMFGICYDCDEFASIESEFLNNVNGKKFQYNCKFCLMYKNEQQSEKLCQCCYLKFNISLNQQLKAQTNMVFCNDCKLQCQGKNQNSCLYCGRKCKKILKQMTINNGTIDICKNARDYLQTFTCQKCRQPYNWKSKIEKQDYLEKSFICC